eukprot:3900406-Pyramimonas_sp.AAC.1
MLELLLLLGALVALEAPGGAYLCTSSSKALLATVLTCQRHATMALVVQMRSLASPSGQNRLNSSK